MVSTEAEECPHGLDIAWCAVCKYGPRKPDPEPTYGAVFQSRYPGTCAICRDPIDADDAIQARFVGERPDGYVHRGCAL
jgi:hypothetical protein